MLVVLILLFLTSVAVFSQSAGSSLGATSSSWLWGPAYQPYGTQAIVLTVEFHTDLENVEPLYPHFSGVAGNPIESKLIGVNGTNYSGPEHPQFANNYGNWYFTFRIVPSSGSAWITNTFRLDAGGRGWTAGAQVGVAVNANQWYFNPLEVYPYGISIGSYWHWLDSGSRWGDTYVIVGKDYAPWSSPFSYNQNPGVWVNPGDIIQVECTNHTGMTVDGQYFDIDGAGITNHSDWRYISTVPTFALVGAVKNYDNIWTPLKPLNTNYAPGYVGAGTNQLLATERGFLGIRINWNGGYIGGQGSLPYRVTVIQNPQTNVVLEVKPPLLTVNEGQTNSFLLRLSSRPSSNVLLTVSFASGDSDLQLVTNPILLITTNDWHLFRPISICAKKDADATEGAAEFLIHAEESSDIIPNQTVQAIERETEAQVQLQASPIEGGTILPLGSPLVIAKSSNLVIQAQARSGFKFRRWEAFPPASVVIGNPSNETTTVEIKGDVVLQSIFDPAVLLTLTTLPVAAGTIFPINGTITIYRGEPFPIGAQAVSGFYFAGWAAAPTSAAMFGDPNSRNTTITASKDVTATALFVTNPPMLDSVYVSTNGSDVFGSGHDDAPYRTIQRGINQVNSSGTVWVDDGVYVEAISFSGKEFKLRSLHGPTRCVIDGNAAYRTVDMNRAKAYIDGFTVRNSEMGLSINNYAYSCIVSNCIFTGNNYSGLYIEANCNAEIYNCQFIRNINRGFCSISWSTARLWNCLIAFNGGPGADTGRNPSGFYNCTIVNNGHGVQYWQPYYVPTFPLYNCIVWGNTNAQIIGDNANATYCNVQGGYPGQGNINADPRFLDPANGNFRLSIGSPCIDAGPTESGPGTDLAGVPRPQGVAYDMGAYEFFLPLLPPEITGQPTDQTVVESSTAVFSMNTASSIPVFYQWFFNQGILVGETNATLTLTSVQVSSAGDYYAVANNSNGFATSRVGRLTVLVPPSIRQQPLSCTANPGSAVRFGVEANGTPPLSYQWFKGSSPISGETNATLDLPAVQAREADIYTVMVGNQAGTTMSLPARLDLMTPATVVAGPSSQTVLRGASVVLSVAATGSQPISYQWFKNGAELAGQTNANLSLTGIQPADQGSYQVKVSNAAGAQLSSAATVMLVDPPTISEEPKNLLTPLGSDASFAVIASGSGPLNYQWYKDDVKLVGQSSSSLLIQGAKASDAGIYVVIIANSWGSITSAGASLTILENTAPIAPNLTYTRAFGLSLKIKIADVLGQCQDSNSDAIDFQSLGTSSQGATLGTTATHILYNPANDNNNEDHFSYIVRDARGATATGTITVQVVKPGGLARSVNFVGGAVMVNFAGIPYYRYDVQRADSLNGPWTLLSTQTAPANGLFSILDASPPLNGAFYRLQQH